MPITSHKVTVDLPTSPPPIAAEPRLYHLKLDAGGISLDGRALSLTELHPHLDAIRSEPASTLILRSHGEAPYDRFDHVMATVKLAGI